MLCFFVPRAQDFYIFLTLHEFYIPQISNFTLPPYTEIRKKTCQIKVRKILMTIFNVFSLFGGLALFGVIGVVVKQLFWPSDSGKPSDKGDRP